MVYSHSFAGVAPGGVVHSRGDGLAPLLRRKTLELCSGVLLFTHQGGEAPERRLWAYKMRVFLVGFQASDFHSGGAGRSKKPCITGALPAGVVIPIDVICEGLFELSFAFWH